MTYKPFNYATMIILPLYYDDMYYIFFQTTLFSNKKNYNINITELISRINDIRTTILI